MRLSCIAIVLVGLVLAASPAGAVAPAGRQSADWSPLESLPTPRAGLAAATDRDGHVYVIGGWGGAGRAVEVLDPATGTWATLASLPVARTEARRHTG